MGYYLGWTYGLGEMPAKTRQITDVLQQKEVIIDGNLGLETAVSEGKLECMRVGYFNNL